MRPRTYHMRTVIDGLLIILDRQQFLLYFRQNRLNLIHTIRFDGEKHKGKLIYGSCAPCQDLARHVSCRELNMVYDYHILRQKYIYAHRKIPDFILDPMHFFYSKKIFHIWQKIRSILRTSFGTESSQKIYFKEVAQFMPIIGYLAVLLPVEKLSYYILPNSMLTLPRILWRLPRLTPPPRPH